MKKKRRPGLLLSVVCLLLLAGLLSLLPELLQPGEHPIPGLTGTDRTLLRIWLVSAPGGGQAWLTDQLRRFEKQFPGVSTYLRTVSPEDLTDPQAVLPDVVLWMPGDVTDPSILQPLSGDVLSGGALREELLRCGRWRTGQYALPLCWGAWVLAIDSTLEPGSAVTPAPTTLLGRPAATSAMLATAEPGYPLSAASDTACALQSPGGAAMFTLGLLLETLPPLPGDFGTLSTAEVYEAFRQRNCATAMLTTGQATAFSALTSAGSGFPFRLMTADTVITDQVWLGSVTQGACAEAGTLLAFLTSPDAQEALTRQALHTVRADLMLYAAGYSARVEQAARCSLTAVNAFIPVEAVAQAAWQFLQGSLSLDEALLPLV